MNIVGGEEASAGAGNGLISQAHTTVESISVVATAGVTQSLSF